MNENGKHWRVVIQIQEVTPAQPETIRQGARVLGPAERRVHEVAGVNVAAASESEAFARAISALTALRPQMEVTSIDEMPRKFNPMGTVYEHPRDPQ